MFDLLWSDPRNEPGRGPSGRGADCMAFGPDITERFLSENQLDVCIRSHQVRDMNSIILDGSGLTSDEKTE